MRPISILKPLPQCVVIVCVKLAHGAVKLELAQGLHRESVLTIVAIGSYLSNNAMVAGVVVTKGSGDEERYGDNHQYRRYPDNHTNGIPEFPVRADALIPGPAQCCFPRLPPG